MTERIQGAQPAPGLDSEALIQMAVDAKLGTKLKPIGQGDHHVFYTVAGYRTSELEDFARAVLAAGMQMPDARSAFEAWAPSQHMRTERWTVNPELYDDEDAISAWQGCQAGAAWARGVQAPEGGDVRTEFERWATAEGYPTGYTPDAECGVEGGPVYADSRTHAAWWAYRAGRADPPKPGTVQWCTKCGEGVTPGMCRRKDKPASEGAARLTPDALADKCEAWLQAGGASNIVDAYEAGYLQCDRDQDVCDHALLAILERAGPGATVADVLDRLSTPAPAEAHGDERAAVLAAAKDVGLIDWVSDDGTYFTFAGSESMSDKLVALWRLASKAQPKGTAKCTCTAYCGQYLMHGSCPAYPAAVTVAPAPTQLTSICHMECGGCIDAGKCAFPGKPAEPVRYPHPDEDDAVTLWAEIHRLRAAVQGPDGYATWQEAATAERVRRVAAEKALAAIQSPAPEERMHPGLVRALADRHFRGATDAADLYAMAANVIREDGQVLAGQRTLIDTLKTRASQAPAVGADDAKDAARFRWLIDDRNWNENEDTPSVCTSEDVHWGDKARALIDRHMESNPPVQGSQQ